MDNIETESSYYMDDVDWREGYGSLLCVILNVLQKMKIIHLEIFYTHLKLFYAIDD